MPRILVCQHVSYEPLGTLDPLFRERGFRIRYVNFDREPETQPSMDGYHSLVVLGGPMCLSQIDEYPHLKHEIKMIEQALKADIPILGICLGAQLLAKTLGAEVTTNREKEIGWYDIELTEEGKQDNVLANFRHQEKIFQWHSDTFSIPDGAVHLAKSATCENQAFRYGDKVYGFQFHLETDEAMIKRWLSIPCAAEQQSLNGDIDADTILEETTAYIEHSKHLSRETFSEFIKLLGLKKHQIVLGSR